MSENDDGQDDMFAPIGEALPKIKALTPVQRRLRECAFREEVQKILFQHTVLAQTSLPYRNPGDDVRGNVRRATCTCWSRPAWRATRLNGGG